MGKGQQTTRWRSRRRKGRAADGEGKGELREKERGSRKREEGEADGEAKNGMCQACLVVFCYFPSRGGISIMLSNAFHLARHSFLSYCMLYDVL